MSEQEQSYEFNTSLSSLDTSFMTDYFHTVSYENVKTWLKNHNSHHKQIRYASKFFYNSNGIYTNVVDYMTALPTLDRVVHGQNKNHKNFKNNKIKFDTALKKIKDKQMTRDMLFKCALYGVSFHYLQVVEAKPFPSTLSDLEIEAISEINNEFNCSLITLPIDYCRIVGQRNGSYVIAMDMSYFNQFTANGRSLKLKRYPKEIRQGYTAFRKDPSKKWYVLDNNRTVAIKVRAGIDEPWGRPLGLSAFVDMYYDEYFVDTKRNVLDDINSTVIYQTFPEGDTKGTSSLSQKQQGEQHNNIKNALFTKGMRKGVNFFSVASGTKLDTITTNIDFLKVKGEDELIKRIATNLGFAGSALNGQDGNHSSQQTNIEMVSAEIFAWLEQIQDEINKVINANIIKDPKVYMEMYYLPITHVNRKTTVQNMKDLYTSGRGSLTAWIASTGWNPDAYLSLMDYEKEEGFDEKYQVHMTSYTASGKDNADSKGGRPEEDSRNENTIKSKTNGSNNAPSPK
ncbi:hypothetical protein ACU3L3_06855 [Priestia endophytica]